MQSGGTVFYLPQVQPQTASSPRTIGRMKLWKRSKSAFMSARKVPPGEKHHPTVWIPLQKTRDGTPGSRWLSLRGGQPITGNT